MAELIVLKLRVAIPDLLSGLLVCDVYGGTVAKRGNSRVGCVSHIMGRGRANGRTINRDALEARVLAGPRNRLMAPDVMAEAIRACITKTNRLNRHHRANREADLLRLEKARKAIAGIVAAIEDGGYSRPLMARLKTLEVDADAIRGRSKELRRRRSVHGRE
jgi:hypothetical protein